MGFDRNVSRIDKNVSRFDKNISRMDKNLSRWAEIPQEGTSVTKVWKGQFHRFPLDLKGKFRGLGQTKVKFLLFPIKARNLKKWGHSSAGRGFGVCQQSQRHHGDGAQQIQERDFVSCPSSPWS